jgi:hypothetical protein
MSNIEIRDVGFEKEFQSALTHHYGQTALFLKDSYF